MYCQFDPKWKNEILGTGGTTIGGYGCNVTSLAYGLYLHGHNYNPRTLNKLFIDNGMLCIIQISIFAFGGRPRYQKTD